MRTTAPCRSRSSSPRTPRSWPTTGSRSTSSTARTRTSRSPPRRISRWQDSSCDPRRATMSKTALVTGASRGIGLETTRRFILNHDDITTVVMFARDSEDFDDAVRELESEDRSEEHTSELQSRGQLVCRLLLEKKKRKKRV